MGREEIMIWNHPKHIAGRGNGKGICMNYVFGQWRTEVSVPHKSPDYIDRETGYVTLVFHTSFCTEWMTRHPVTNVKTGEGFGHPVI